MSAHARAPKVRSIRTQRQIGSFSDGSEGLSRISEAFGAFMPAIAQSQRTQQAIDLNAIETENRELSISAETAVLADPAKALEALQANDISAFAPNAEALERKAFTETFEITLGRSMARTDHDAEFSQQLNELDFRDGDPEGLRNGFLGGKLHGAKRLFGAAYTEEFDKRSASNITAWRGQQRAFLSARAVNLKTDLIIQDIQAGEPVSRESIAAQVADVVSLAQGASAKLTARKTIMLRIMQEAQKTEGLAILKALSEPDPVTGLAYKDEFPELFRKTVDRTVQDYSRFHSVREQASILSIQSQMDILENGLGGDIATITNLVDAHEGNFKAGSAVDALRRRINKVNAGAIEQTALFPAFLSAADPKSADQFVSTKDLNKYGEALQKQYFEQGGTIDGMARIAAKHGTMGTGPNERVTQAFMGKPGKDSEEAYEFLKRIQAEDTSGVGALDNILSEEARTKFAYIFAAETVRGQSVSEAQNDLAKIDPTSVTKPASFLKDQGSTRDFEAITDTAGRELLELIDADGISPEVLAHLRVGVNQTAFIGNLSGTKDKKLITKGTAEAMAGQIEVGARGLLVLRQSPRFLTGPDNIRRPARPMTEKLQKIARKDFNAASEVYGGIFGKAVGALVSENITGAGLGFAMLVEDGGIESEVVLPFGFREDFTVQQENPDYVPGEFRSPFFIDTPGTFQLPEVLPADGWPVNDSGSLRFIKHPDRPGFAILVYTGKGLPTAREKRVLLDLRFDEDVARAAQGQAHRRTKEARLATMPPGVGVNPGLFGITGTEILDMQLATIERELENTDDITEIARWEGYRKVLLAAPDEFQSQRDLEAHIREAFDQPPIAGQGSMDAEPTPVDTRESFKGRIRFILKGLTEKQAISPTTADALEQAYTGPSDRMMIPPEDAPESPIRRLLKGLSALRIISPAAAHPGSSDTEKLESFDTARVALGQAEHKLPGDLPTTRPQDMLLGMLEKTLISDEGYREFMYFDTKEKHPVPTFAMGFNLERPDAAARLKSVGLDLKKVMAKEQGATREQSMRLMRMDNEDTLRVIYRQFPEWAPRTHELSAIMQLRYNWPNGFRDRFSKLLPKAMKANDRPGIIRALWRLHDEGAVTTSASDTTILQARMRKIIAQFLGVDEVSADRELLF